ncbi:hypothetical protein M8818_001840 [Zalaria obscura]|uniref:Uncharacterized protein n=1 Tax=Zalaria obscura TaxID=2024903 RepID=A0ACC3SLG9_9PEZI
MSPPISPFESHRKEILELAADEGHDADIPSNAGWVTDAEDAEKAPRSPTHSSEDRDLEKGELRSSIDKTATQPTASTTEQAPPADPNIVDWDGPDDPANPMNFTPRTKAIHIAVLSFTTLIPPLASSMFAPGVPEVLTTFHTTSSTLATFVVSVFLLGFALGPLLISPLSELYGRWKVYVICSVGFVVFTVACAVANSMGQLIAFRFLSGCFGVAPITIGGGTIADMIPQERRGAIMAIWAMGPLIGPVIGPVAGGYLAGDEGWRWVFWVLAIAAGICGFLLTFCTRETYAPVLLARKVALLRKETGNESLRSKYDNGLVPAELFKRAIVRPSRMLLFSPIVAAMSVYMAVVYGILYLLFTTFTFVFTENYSFTERNVGLVYIGCGIGMLSGLVLLGATSDRIALALAKKNNDGAMKPEYRLPGLFVMGPFIPAGLFLYGWSAQYAVQWAVPLLGTLFVGLGMLGVFMCIQTYLVDAFTVHAASAIAANTVLRSVLGALLPLAGLKMYDVLGLGWGNRCVYLQRSVRRDGVLTFWWQFTGLYQLCSSAHSVHSLQVWREDSAEHADQILIWNFDSRMRYGAQCMRECI